MPLIGSAATFAFLALVAAGSELVSPDHPFGWLGAMLLAALSGLTLWRAGSVKAWKETAEAREQRIDDLEVEVAELRAELRIPDRFEGIIGMMGEIAVRQDAAAAVRLEGALGKLEGRFAALEVSIREACTRGS